MIAALYCVTTLGIWMKFMCRSSYSMSTHAYYSWCSFSLAISCFVTDSASHFFMPASTHGPTHAHTQGDSFPLQIGCEKGYDGVVEMLLQAGATVDLLSKVEDCYYDSTSFICHL